MTSPIKKIPTTDTDSITFMVVSPKETRDRQRIVKDITIAPHPVKLLCPVSTLTTYLARIATQPCHHRHPTLSEVTINYLFRSLNDHSKHIQSQAISKHVKQIMSLIPSYNNRLIKPRALGSTRAVRAGASIDDVVAHGNWSSESIFNNFYRLSRETQSNFTMLTLDEPQGSTSRALDSQSLDPPLNEE